MQLELSDYNVIITGGTRGIGRSIAEAFLKEGADVTVTYLSNTQAAEAFSNDWPDAKLQTVKSDVSDYSQAEKFFGEYDKTHDALHVLVNNAGIRRDNVVGMMPPDDWQSVITTNLGGTYNMSKFAVMKMMQNRFGRIINITSPSGKFGFAGQANYAAAKAGQVAFTKSLARETAKRAITVNCVSPGFIETELIADLPDDLRKEYKSQVPLKRFGTTDEVASAVLFLASRDASYITGSVLEVTGGL